MPTPQRLDLGPWPNGLILQETNAERDASSGVTGTALQKAINVDVTDDGYLQARPGCQRIGVLATHYTDVTRSCRVLGSIFEGGSLCAILGIQTGGNTKIYLTPDGYTLYSYGTLTGLISSVQQYNNVIYFTRSDADSGYSVPNNLFSTPFSSPTASSVVTNMPRGDKSFVFKDRLFIVNKASSTINFSAPADFSDYTVDSGGGNFIVNPSSDAGAQIMDVVITNETFYIFKRHSTFLFSYDANPNDDGVLRLINSALGGFSATTWENDVYVLNTAGVYRIVNGVFVRLDEALDLASNYSLASIIDPISINRPTFIHAFANRLMVGYFGSTLKPGNFAGNYFVMNLNTGAWSGYKFVDGFISPSGAGTTAQLAEGSGGQGVEVFPSIDYQYFCRIPTVRRLEDYTLDSKAADTTVKRYIPNVSISTYPYNAGFAYVFKKIHRYFLRSNIVTPNSAPLQPSWYIAVEAEDLALTLSYALLDPNDAQYASRLQSEIKLPIAPARARNFNFTLSCAEEPTGRVVTEIDPGVPIYDFLVSGFSFDISLPRGNSPR